MPLKRIVLIAPLNRISHLIYCKLLCNGWNTKYILIYGNTAKTESSNFHLMVLFLKYRYIDAAYYNEKVKNLVGRNIYEI